MKSLVSFMAALAMAIASAGAMAHDDATMDKQKAPNGGQLRMAGPYHFELVLAKGAKGAKESPVIVYVTDHAGTKITTVGATGSATLLSGKAKVAVTLTPDGDNRLKGAARYVAEPGIKAVVSITLAGKTAEQARFTPLAEAGAGHTTH